MLQPPTSPAQKVFQGDRYERFRQAVEILVEDENVAAAEPPFGSEGLSAFAADLIDMRALDGLSDSDANWLGMLAAFDFCRGLPRFGWRINDMLSEEPTFTPEGGFDNELAVLHAYVKIFHSLLGAFTDESEPATKLRVENFDMPALPTPKAGDDPVFIWDTFAEVRAGDPAIVSVVRRFAYWDEKDNKPLEVGFEAYIDGLPDTCGVADVVATNSGVLVDLAAVAAKAAELLDECNANFRTGVSL